MRKSYSPPSTLTIEIEATGILAISKVPVGSETERFDSPKQQNKWGNIWQ